MTDLRKTFYCVWLALCGFTSLIAQQSITWDKTGNGSWNNPNNWSCNCIPTALDVVLIEHDSVIISNETAAVAKRVWVGKPGVAGVGLAIFPSGSLTINSSGATGLIIQDSAALFIGGNLTIFHEEGTGIDNKFGGKILNVGEVIIQHAYTTDQYLAVTNSDSITNQGIFRTVFAGIKNQGIHARLINKDSLYVGFAAGVGLAIIDKAQVKNESGGRIHITQMNASPGTVGIEIFNVNPGITRLTNDGIINIEFTSGYGIYLRGNVSQLNNDGNILINQAEDYGLYLEGVGHFANNGSCLLTNNIKGVIIKGSSDFTLTEMSEFKVVNSTSDPFTIDPGAEIIINGELFAE